MRMPFYALTIIQLIQSLPDMVKQVWYVDNASAGGELQDLCIRWNQLSWLGILYGYLPNDKKILLRAGDDLQTTLYIADYIVEKVNLWIGGLAAIARS